MSANYNHFGNGNVGVRKQAFQTTENHDKKGNGLSKALRIYDSYFATLAVELFREKGAEKSTSYTVHGLAVAVLIVAYMASVADDVLDFQARGYSAVIDGFMNTIYVLQVVWTYSAIYWRQKELRRILKDIDDIVPFVVGDGSIKIYDKVYETSKLIIGVVVVQSVIPCIGHLLEMTLGKSATDISPAVVIYRLIHVVFILPHHFFFMTFLLFVCSVLSTCFQQLKLRHRLRAAEEGGVTSQKAISVFVNYHSQLCDIVNDLSDVYGDCFALWNASELVMFIFSFRLLDLNRERPNFTLDLVINLIYPVVYFTVQAIYVSALNESVLTSLKGLTTVSKVSQAGATDDDSRGKIYETTSNRILLYIHHIFLTLPAINGKGLFTVEKTMILGVAGTCMTYILTLYGIKF